MTSISPDVQRVLDQAYGRSQVAGTAVDMSRLEHPHRPFSFGYIGAQLLIAGAGIAVSIGAGYGIKDWAMATHLLLFCLSMFIHFARKSMEPKPVNWIGADTVFLIPYGLFHYGYLIAYLSVGKIELSDRIFYSEEYFNFTLMHTLNCSIAFLIGFELWKVRRGPVMNYTNPVIPSNLLSMAGAVVVILAFGSQWAFIMMFGFGNATANYTALAGAMVDTDARIFAISFFVGMMGIGMYCVCSSLRYRKLFGSVLIGGIIVACSLFILLLGDRGGFVQFATPACLAYYYFVRKVRIYWILLAFVGLLFFFSVLSAARDETAVDVAKMMAIAEEKKADENMGFFLRLFLEAGSSISTVGISMGLMEGEGEEFWYGRSYWHGIETLMPNIGGSKRDTGGFEGATPAQWLTTIGKERGLTAGAGMGSSIAMEAYINFGMYFGPLVLLLIGLIYRGMYERVLCKPTVVSGTTYCVATTMLLIWTRNSSSYVIRYVIWTFVFTYVVSSIFGTKAGSAKRA
jgi:oligosaccharide repeat unit polymerase